VGEKMTVYRKKIGGKTYDFFDEFRTLNEAEKKKSELIRSGFATSAIISKSTQPDTKKPFRLWMRSDPAVHWKNAVKKGVLNEIDKELRGVVKELNATGVYTAECCSGHHERPGMLWLYKESFSLKAFLSIMKKHGLVNVKRRSQYSDSNRDIIYFTFDLPGKVTYKQTNERVIRPKKKVVRNREQPFGMRLW
jgi:hypothetical protein